MPKPKSSGVGGEVITVAGDLEAVFAFERHQHMNAVAHIIGGKETRAE